jgi:hypothetical protein
VLSWSISRDDKLKLTNVKIISNTGVHETCRPSGARPRPSRPRGRSAGPTSWPVAQSLSRFSPRLDGHVATSVHKGYPTLEVSGIREEWPTGHVDRCPAIHLLQTDLVKSVQAPLCLYKRPLMMKVDTHTPHYGDFTCKAHILSVVTRCNLVGRVVRL